MDDKYVMRVAQTIKEQLVGLTSTPILMSWGITEFVATEYMNKPALRIKVNGRLHNGYVMVALNGADFYEVYLLYGKEVVCVNKEVYYDELSDTIDRAIEKGNDPIEYEKFCDQQLVKLFC